MRSALFAQYERPQKAARREELMEFYRKHDLDPAEGDQQDAPGAAAVYRELKRGETAGDDGAPILDRNQRRALPNPEIHKGFPRFRALTGEKISRRWSYRQLSGKV